MKRSSLLLATLLFVFACAPIAQQATPDGAGKDAPLENTYWKLTLLGNASMRTAPNQQEAHFMLHSAERRVTGSGGCNRLTGGYELEGDKLTFGRMASTMMACAGGMVSEQRFLTVLQETRKAKVTRQQLELLDASGRVMAQFEAVQVKK